jgi:hypothetical protein
MRECDGEEIARAIKGLTYAINDLLTEHKSQFTWMVSHHYFATKQDLERLNHDLSMKLSEIKTAVTTAALQNREAFTEIGTKIADLNQQIADLIKAQTDPDVNDEAFLASLTALQSDAQALADIVPGSPSDGSGQVP